MLQASRLNILLAKLLSSASHRAGFCLPLERLMEFIDVVCQRFFSVSKCFLPVARFLPAICKTSLILWDGCCMFVMIARLFVCAYEGSCLPILSAYCEYHVCLSLNFCRSVANYLLQRCCFPIENFLSAWNKAMSVCYNSVGCLLKAFCLLV
jgi:hypothetical protein